MKYLILFFSFSLVAQAQVTRQSANRPIVRARIFAVTTSWAPIAIPTGRIQRIHCQNAGTNSVRLNFDSQPNTQYWEALQGDRFPEIHSHQNLIINVRSTGGPSSIQCILQSN